LSPQSRRGRAAPASHKKSPGRGAATASRKPVAAADEFDEGEVDDQGAQAPVRSAKTAPVRRQRGFARLKKTSGYKYGNELFVAYLPLIGAFVVIFALVWIWISFGPHPLSPKDHWMQIENTWAQKREDARTSVTNAVNDFTAQKDGYKTFGDDTRAWMAALASVSDADWNGPNPSFAYGSSNSDLVLAFENAGNAEAALLDQVFAAQTPNDVLALGDQITADEQTFDTTYENARSQIVGIRATDTSQPTLAMPSGSLCPSSSASLNPSASASPSPSTSPSPSATSSLSASPSASASASASVVPDACAPSSSGSPGASGSAGSSGAPGPSGTPGPTPSDTPKPA
jgi:hypothetical protein